MTSEGGWAYQPVVSESAWSGHIGRLTAGSASSPEARELLRIESSAEAQGLAYLDVLEENYLKVSYVMI